VVVSRSKSAFLATSTTWASYIQKRRFKKRLLPLYIKIFAHVVRPHPFF